MQTWQPCLLSAVNSFTSSLLMHYWLQLTQNWQDNILWMTKEQSKVQTGQANCWCVYKWQHHFNVIHDSSVEQALIACEQVHQVDVLVEVSGTSFNIQHSYLHLVVLTQHSWRQQAMDLQVLFLTHCKTPTLTNNQPQQRCDAMQQSHVSQTANVYKCQIL